MNIKKIIASVAAAAIAVSALAISAFAGQDASGFADGTAYLNINTSDWAEFDANWTNAEVTGDGTYTVSMTDAAINIGQFNALEILNGEKLFGRTYTVTVDSIKINGIEQKVNEGYTCSADGVGVTTRVNLYNEWNSPSEEVSDDGFVDCRAADGDVMSKSAQMIDAGCLESETNSIEVTFTVAGTGSAAAADTAADTAADAGSAETTSAATGNTSAAVIVSVMALAGIAAAASKRK